MFETYCNRALGDGGDTIHLVGVILADSVEVNTRTVVCQAIANMNNNSITPIGFNGRAW